MFDCGKLRICPFLTGIGVVVIRWLPFEVPAAVSATKRKPDWEVANTVCYDRVRNYVRYVTVFIEQPVVCLHTAGESGSSVALGISLGE